MARPEHRTARKGYPDHGIKKGDKYWFVSLKTGPRSSRTLRQLTPFKPSQLTTSEYLSALYDWQDDLSKLASMDDAQALADAIGELGDEQRSKYDNMPEGLQQGETGQMIEARADACEQAKSDIEDIIGEWETARDQWETDYETYKEALDEYNAAKEEYDAWDEEDGTKEPDEPEEPDLPENTNTDNAEPCFDEEDFISRVQEVEVSE